jgi:hypothetical protein
VEKLGWPRRLVNSLSNSLIFTIPRGERAKSRTPAPEEAATAGSAAKPRSCAVHLSHYPSDTAHIAASSIRSARRGGS